MASPAHREPRSSPGRCPNCGTENDPFYTFCRNCLAQLPGSSGQ